MANPLADISHALDILGTTPGCILVRGAFTWYALEPGTENQILVIGADDMPHWVDPV